MTDPPPRLRKSDLSRAAILGAARRLFARDGFERTTLRAVATEAGIDASMIIRYFGSKEGLFATASDIALRMPNLTRTPRDRIGERLVDHFLDRWESDLGLQALLRAAVSDEAVAAKARSIFAAQILPVVEQVSDAGDTRGRAGLLTSQMLGLALTRYILRIPGVADMPRDEIVRRVGATVQAYVAGDA